MLPESLYSSRSPNFALFYDWSKAYTPITNHRRCTIKVSQAVDFHLKYHRANSKKNTIKTYEFALHRFTKQFGKRGLASISQEEIPEFLMSLTKDNKQRTKRNPIISASILNALIALTNPCNTSVIKKILKRPQAIQWQIVDKEKIDEIIFRTMNPRNRLMLELMAIVGMRIGEVLSLTPIDILESSMTTHNPRSGNAEETVYVHRKILVRLSEYV